MLVQLKCRRNTLKSVATELFSLTRLGQTCNPAALRSEPAQLEFCPIDQQHYRSAGHVRYCISLLDKETCRVQFILDISECYARICDWSRQIKYISNLHKSKEKNTQVYILHFSFPRVWKKRRGTDAKRPQNPATDLCDTSEWNQLFKHFFFFSPRCYFTIRGGGEGSCLKIPPCKWSLGSQPSWSGPLGSRVFFWIFIHELNRASPANRKNFQPRIKESFYSSSGWIKKTSWTNTTQESRTLISSSKNTPVPF